MGGIAVAAVLALGVSACGSSKKSNSTSTSSTPTAVSGIPQTGPGLTEATSPSGSKIKGGTVTFALAPQTTPNYIFPMTSFAYCSVANTSQFSSLLYRPLYYYGNNYSPTVDYNYSIGKAPVWSNGNKTVTIHLNSWKWSNGEQVTSRDIELWINVYKSDAAANYCGYVPGLFPDNVVSTSLPNSSTIVLNLNKSYDPEWFLYNELSQITPIPLAWDRTSLSQAAPTKDTGSLPDTTKAGALAVYKFLDAQSKKLADWASSPVWSVVDGPWKLQSFTATGESTFVPNSTYSGTPKATISKFVELPFTSDAAAFNEFRSAGPSATTIAYLPAQYVPQTSAITSTGYVDNKGSSYSVNYFPLNWNNPTVGPFFRKLYFRQALQYLVDQQGWISAFLKNTAVETYSPVPSAPPNPLIKTSSSGNPYSFSVAAAKTLLTNNGWKVVPNGQTTCVKPGGGAGECGAGVKQGQALKFDLDYASGTTAIVSEMNDLAAQAKQVGMTIELSTHPFDTVVGAAVPCKPSQATCKWEAENWGAGWIYSPDFLPTGESLFLPGAASNAGSYDDAGATKLINETVYTSAENEARALSTYADYMAKDLPVVFGPTSIGVYGGTAGTLISDKLGGWQANAFSYLTPEAWYLVK